ncbi:MAG: MltA domain-containing protein [Gammaproteobacteria bacterium]
MNCSSELPRGAALLAVVVLSALLFGCGTPPRRTTPVTPSAVVKPTVQYERARWSALPGWAADDVREVWPALLKSCRALRFRPEWSTACTAAQAANAQSSRSVRSFFEQYFEPYQVLSVAGAQREESGLVTGYYEPQLTGSRTQSSVFNTPLYSPPPDLLTIDLASLYPELKGKRLRGRLEGNRVVPYYSRAEIGADTNVRGYEIVWVNDALDAFLLQVQGSGRVVLPNGETIRLQFADQNGYPYQSIGRYLIERGDLTTAQATLPGIRQWLTQNPTRLQEVLNANPSVVFFREEKLDDPTQGPKGAFGVPLTAGRSIAVDPASIPLGAPVFLATTRPAADEPLQRLVMAQDTGGAIRGIVRADFFWGFGPEAGAQAGNMRQQGRMWLLWPKGAALPTGS